MTTLLLTPLIEELRNGARCETISYPWLRAGIAMPDLRGACLVGGCYLGSLSLVFRRCRIIAEVNLACIKALILPLRGGQLGWHIYCVLVFLRKQSRNGVSGFHDHTWLVVVTGPLLH